MEWCLLWLRTSDYCMTSASVTIVVKEARIAVCEHFVVTYIDYLQKFKEIKWSLTKRSLEKYFFP